MPDEKLNEPVNVGVTLDTVSFLKETLKGIMDNYDFAYPCNQFNEDRAHTALQSIKGRVKTLQIFLNNLK